MESFLIPTHPIRCIITGPSEGRKSFLWTNFVLKIFEEYDKIYIYSPSLKQVYIRKKTKRFRNIKLFLKILNISNEENIDVVIEKIVKNKDFQKSVTILKHMNQ